MLLVDDLIGNKGMVGIVRGDNDIHGVFFQAGIVIHDRAQFGKNDPGNLLFDDLVGLLLQLLIDGQIHVVSGSRLYEADLFCHLTDTVHIEDLLPPVSLEYIVHDLLDPGFSDDVG